MTSLSQTLLWGGTFDNCQITIDNVNNTEVNRIYNERTGEKAIVMTRPPEIKNRTSAGGIIFRSAADQQAYRGEDIEVAIIAVKGGKAWCLPKGIIDKGEDPPAAALREVREETGLRGEIIDKIGRISYWYYLKKEEVRVHKTVHFFLMKYLDGSTDDHDHEVDDARWYRIHDAVQTLSYKSEKEMMRKAQGMIEGFLGTQS